MSFLFDDNYYKVGKSGISPFQNLCAYLGGSAIQTVGDNPVTAYRQLVQQYAKNLDGVTVDPKVASAEANAVFLRSPISACLSGLWPRMIGVLLKRVPKFGFLLGYGFLVGEGEPGFAAATCASILSAPFINPVRMVEKQQRTRRTSPLCFLAPRVPQKRAPRSQVIGAFRQNHFPRCSPKRALCVCVCASQVPSSSRRARRSR